MTVVRQKVPSLCFGLDQQGTQCEGQAASTALRQGLGCQNCRTAFPEKLEMLQEEGGGRGRGEGEESGKRDKDSSGEASPQQDLPGAIPSGF